ncbi:FCS-Like Zinc finger 1-like [Wolffia australiana]
MEPGGCFSVPVSKFLAIWTRNSRHREAPSDRYVTGDSVCVDRASSSLLNPKSVSKKWIIYKNWRRHPSRLFLESRDDSYFLDACFLCDRPLRHDRDIYMYRGDIPFCSEECRKEQMDIDEAVKRRRTLAKASPSKAKRSSLSQSVGIHGRGTTVAS